MLKIVSCFFKYSRPIHWFAIIINSLVASIIFNLDYSVGLLIGVQLSCLASFGFIMNDFLDIKIDEMNLINRMNRINKYERGLIFGLSYIYLLICFSLAIFLNSNFLISLLFILVLLILYNLFLKKIFYIGNISAAFIIMSPLWVPMFNNNLYEIPSIYLFIFAFSVVYHFSRELTMDIFDMNGDSHFGRKTYPIILGKKFTLIIAQTLNILGFLFLILFISFNTNENTIINKLLMLFLAILCAALNFKNSIRLLNENNFENNYNKYIKYSRISMIVFPLMLIVYHFNLTI